MEPERCPKCGLEGRPRRYPVTQRVAMLVCRYCNGFLRYCVA